MTLSNLSVKLLPKGCRYEQLEGREHVVVPMVILTEGVHVGSLGPLYYPPDELEKTPQVWNHKPIVVYHPEINGNGISACQPDIINNRKVGLMLNTSFEKGKLKSEAWIDTSRVNNVDERIMAAVKDEEMMELSTGVFIEKEETTGKWKNEPYTGIARNYKPDHLALLPDQIGACSISDGAGFLRNRAGDGKGLTGQALEFLRRLVGNELSYSNIHSSLQTKLREKFPTVNNDGPYCWVLDVFSNFFIYEKESKIWRLGYMSNETDVSLSDETPVEVKRVTEYRTVKGDFVGNDRHTQDQNMKLKEKVDGIVAANAGWTEADRENLLLCTEEQVDSMIALHKAMPGATFAGFKLDKGTDGKVTMVVRNAEAPAAATTTKQTAPAAAAPAAEPKEKQVINVDEYVAQAPEAIREVLRNSMSALNEEKSRLVDGILKNTSNPYSKEELNAKPIGELRKLARLAMVSEDHPATPRFDGMGRVENVSTEEEVLSLPAMNFDKKEKAA